MPDLIIDGDDHSRSELKRATHFMQKAKAQADENLNEGEQGGVHYWEKVVISRVRSFASRVQTTIPSSTS